MVVIWKWDGTMEQLEKLTSPIGYTQNLDLISLSNQQGKHCLQIKAQERIGGGGELAGAIAIYLRFPEIYTRAMLFFPPDYSGVRTDGTHGWINLGPPFMYMSNGQPWTSGSIQIYEFAGDGFLRLGGSYRETPEGETIYTGYHPTFRFLKGQWYEWKQYIRLDEVDGQVIHWINNEVLYNFNHICTDPTRVIGSSTPRTYWRQYVDNGLNFPQYVYWAGLAVQTEPFNGLPEPNLVVDSNPRNVPFTIESL